MYLTKFHTNRFALNIQFDYSTKRWFQVPISISIMRFLMQITTSNQDSPLDMPRPFIRKNMCMAYDNVITCHHENISTLVYMDL